MCCMCTFCENITSKIEQNLFQIRNLFVCWPNFFFHFLQSSKRVCVRALEWVRWARAYANAHHLFILLVIFFQVVIQRGKHFTQILHAFVSTVLCWHCHKQWSKKEEEGEKRALTLDRKKVIFYFHCCCCLSFQFVDLFLFVRHTQKKNQRIRFAFQMPQHLSGVYACVSV